MAGETVMSPGFSSPKAASGLPAASQQAIYRALHYIFPSTLFFFFLSISAFALCSLAGQKKPKRRISRRTLVWSQVLVALSYVAQTAAYIVRPLLENGNEASEDNIVYVLASFIVWGFFIIALVDTEQPVWYVYRTTWTLALVFEFVIANETIKGLFDAGLYEYIKLGAQAARILLLVVMLGITILSPKDQEEKKAESQPLLAASTTAVAATDGYGTVEVADDTADGSKSDSEDDDADFDWYAVQDKAKKKMMKKIQEKGNWWLYAKEYALFWPLVWPTKKRGLQLRMFAVGFCLLLTRVLNVMVPRQLGQVTDSLDGTKVSQPLLEVSLYVIYRFLASGSGVSAVQDYLWLPIEQYSYKTITTVGYNHLMSLSHNFHTSKSTSDLFVTISQGRSITGIVETVCFKMGPMLIDLVVAVGYLNHLFGSYVALVVAAVAISYFYVTIKLGTAANAMRKSYNDASRKEVRYMWGSVENWQTVNLFNRINYEMDRYGSAIKDFVTTQRLYYLGVSVTGVAQSMIFTLGLLAASFIAVHQVTMGTKRVGDFVTLLSYWSQLSYPLHFFASFLRQIQSQMVDAERLLELLQTKPEVADKDTSRPIMLKDGEVEFENVEFAYDKRKPTLKGISLRVPGGTTVALVGQSGGGKTTCLKLLFRFYDVLSGSIKIDGQDLRDITLDSLRESVSVVPQDPELFDVTIMENIRYAKLEATDEEIYTVCKAAAIHEKIMGFPDGYHSKVGPRGVKLSGGELQRIAIARALLKDTKIVLLDEATSMVDMNTEKMIQNAFKELAHGRTMFIVAHRLSTIMRADKIVVIQDGKIAEQGSHDELFEAKGKYYDLWLQNSANVAGDGKKKDISGDLLLDTNDAEVLAKFEALKPKNTVDKGVSTTVEEPSSPVEPASANKAVAFTFDKPLFPTRTDSEASVMTIVGPNPQRRSSILKPEAQPFIPPPHVIQRLASPTKEQQEAKQASPTEISALKPIFTIPNFGSNENAPTSLVVRRLSADNAATASSSDEANQPPQKRHRRRRNRNRGSRTSGGNLSENGSSLPGSGTSTPALRLMIDTSSTAPPLPSIQISPTGMLTPIIQLPRSVPVTIRAPTPADDNKKFGGVDMPKKPLQATSNASSAPMPIIARPSSAMRTDSARKVVTFDESSSKEVSPTTTSRPELPPTSQNTTTGPIPRASMQPSSNTNIPANVLSAMAMRPQLKAPQPTRSAMQVLGQSQALSASARNIQPAESSTAQNIQRPSSTALPSQAQSNQANQAPTQASQAQQMSGRQSSYGKRRWGSTGSGAGQGTNRPVWQKRRSSSAQQGGTQDSGSGSQGGAEKK